MNLAHSYSGALSYLTARASGAHVLLVIIPCQVGSWPAHESALFDSAAEWCVLPPWIAEDLGYLPLDAGPRVHLATRFGIFTGTLERIPLHLLATHGEPLTIEATWFVCPDWPGPMVIGWKGGLERFRFALDPGEEAFYFAEL